MAYRDPLDLGNGTYRFTDDAGQQIVLPATPSVVAHAQSLQAAPPTPAQLSPDIAAAAAPGPDMQTAMAPARPGAGPVLSDVPMPVPGAGGVRTSRFGTPIDPNATGSLIASPQELAGRHSRFGAPLPKPPAELGAIADQPITADAGAGSAPPGGLIFAKPQAAAPPGAPGQGAGRVVPGGFQPHSRTVQAQAPIPEGDLTDIKRGITGQMAANDAMGQQQAVQAGETAGELGAQANQLDRMQQHAENQELIRQDRLEKAQAKYDQMNNALQSQHIDPARAFRNDSDSDKFFTALMVGLSTLGSGMAHTDNSGLKLFRSRIEDDIAAQNKDLDTSGRAVENQRGLVGMMREQFGDARAADAAARMQYIDMGKQRLAEIAQRGLGAEGQAKVQAANAALQTDWAKEKAKFDQAVGGVVSQSDIYRPAQLVGGPAAPEVAKDDERFLTLPDGTTIHASSKAQAEEWGQILPAADRVERNVDEATAILSTPNFQDADRAKLAINQAVNSMAPLVTGGKRSTAMGELETVLADLHPGTTLTSDITHRTRRALALLKDEAIEARNRIHNSARPYTQEIVNPKTGEFVHVPLPAQPKRRAIKTSEVE